MPPAAPQRPWRWLGQWDGSWLPEPALTSLGNSCCSWPQELLACAALWYILLCFKKFSQDPLLINCLSLRSKIKDPWRHQRGTASLLKSACIYMMYKRCIEDVNEDRNTNESRAGCCDCNYTLQIHSHLYAQFSYCKCMRVFRVNVFAFQILIPLSTWKQCVVFFFFKERFVSSKPLCVRKT